MTEPLASLSQSGPAPSAESSEVLPAELVDLLASGARPAGDEWQRFVDRYSRLLLRVAFAFAPGYDGGMDRYVFILERLRQDDYARLRRFAADGRGRFSTWLVVVARRLCVDHHRCRYGRTRLPAGATRVVRSDRLMRRRLTDLAGNDGEADSVADSSQPDPLEALDRAECGRALRRAMEDLDPADRLLLKLRFEQDLTAREIAVLMKLPGPFHVYRRARAICARLRARLDSLVVADWR